MWEVVCEPEEALWHLEVRILRGKALRILAFGYVTDSWSGLCRHLWTLKTESVVAGVWLSVERLCPPLTGAAP